MIKLIHNDTTYQLPTTAEELTLRQWQAMMACIEAGRSDYIALIGAVTGLDDNAVLLGEGNADEFAYHLDGMAKELNEWPTQKRKVIEVGGQEYTVKDWGLHKLGQRIAFLNAFDGQNLAPKLHEFLAILLAPQVYGKHWADSIELLAEELREAPAHQAVPVAYFFLRRRWSMRAIGRKVWYSLQTRLSKTRGAKRSKGSARLTR